ncbi:hypothetical protein V5799_033452 [Amblyomma americanum]|uniref:Uncharacterized protein n=1 Tax=Amblyomma americanum TaxID=6943 RepID=A0AAQ4DN97_AMBAM
MLGPDMKEDTVLPCDGICSHILLDWLPVDKTADLAGPYPANVTRFLQGARSYRGTEFGVAFNSHARIKMKEALADPASRKHLNSLIEKRVTYFGYINTDTYMFNASEMTELLRVLKICRNDAAQESKEFNCLYYADGNTSKAYTGESRKTLSYKVCAGKKNVTSVQYGIAVGNVEYADVSGTCGEASFALLRALRRIITFFRDHYKSATDFEKCLEAGDKPVK